jgi:hypothetical protein
MYTVKMEGIDSLGKFIATNRSHGVMTQKPTILILFAVKLSHLITLTERRSRVIDTFVFGRSGVHISARKPDILTEYFRRFPQYLQANAGIVI